MKVFKFEKVKNYDIVQEVFHIEINEKEKVSHIVINNPYNSNRICVVNNLMCKLSSTDNIVHLIAANIQNDFKQKMKFGTLSIGYNLYDKETKDHLELDIRNMDGEKEIDILDKDFLIILPGGNICIKLEKPEEQIRLGITLGEQVI